MSLQSWQKSEWRNGKCSSTTFMVQNLTSTSSTLAAPVLSRTSNNPCGWRLCGFLFIFLLALQCILCEKCSLESVAVDVGSNVSFPCQAPGAVLWVREGQWMNPSRDSTVDAQGNLHLLRVRTNDAGLYECQADTLKNETQPCQYILQRINLTVRTSPPALNVSVHPSTVLALVMWHVLQDGGYPLTSIHVQYKETEVPGEAWLRTIPDHVGPGTNLLEIYNLQPNTSYSFRVWAVNALGPGAAVVIVTRTNAASDQLTESKLAEAARKFDPRVWLTAVLCVLIVFGVGLSALAIFLIKDRFVRSTRHIRLEAMEMVPHIITNPAFELEFGLHDQAVGGLDENLNDRQLLLENNNSVVQRPR